MKRILLVSAFVLLAASTLEAQTPFPMLMSLKPVAAQAGKTSEHTVLSRYSMYGANRVLVTGEGVAGEIVTPIKKLKPGEKKPNLTSIKIKFTVAPGAKPGVRDFRIATPQGASTLGQLVIVRDAVIVEKGNNDAAPQAQEITIPSTVCGAIEKSEDVDYFKFKVKAGDALSFHVRSMRLQDKIHDLQTHSDPILSLRVASVCSIPHLVYSAKDLAVRARVIGQNLETAYESGGATVGVIDAASDYVCATDGPGRRIFLWKTTAPTSPSAEFDGWSYSEKPILDLWMKKVPTKS